ncbi:pyridoxal phosphate-dependent aminotransferase [Euzebya tangerina]|uniref:pyridoxal phosphate-dependent aminotransferase n=1 Tax=Euzebya tangerina TaxID=591198 RepID=UPI000E31926D|nr:aminotransferase class I/II-fold pyridoxal phosphate-dependent enzyme [Euzebya tangerina]
MGPSDRGGVSPFVVMEVMRAAEEREAAGGDVLHLEVGQPMTPAPSGVLTSAARALETERLGYTGATGIPELRGRIAAFYAEQYGVDVDPDRVVATVGASGGFVIALLAAFDVGDRVAMTFPGYAAYRNILDALGLEVVPIRVDETTRWVAAADALEAAGPLDGVVVASPSNPTGTTMTAEEMATVGSWCDRNDVRMISDEIYHGITTAHDAPTALAHTDRAIVVQSFSKYFSMTGWRLGWNVVPADLRVATERLSQNLFICPPALSQVAGIAAFDCREELESNVARYSANIATLRASLEACGLDRMAPTDGAFYLWVDVSDLTDDSRQLSTAWLHDIGVAATPGIDFDPEQGHRWMRFSVSESPDVIAEAGRRIAGWVADRP